MTTISETTTAQTTIVTSETPATTTVATTIESTSATTTTAVETTAVPTTTNDGTSVLTGQFDGAEWGDYLHVNILGDDGLSYSFFVLKYPGLDVETLTVGQKVKVIWKNSDEYLNPPGETRNIDVAISIELVG
ncbi:MAG TPA: hypothetical protein DCM45_00985 [Clostridiales bacterium]|nr:hypothetical protein [Clostridiales bacterium]